MNRDVAVRGGTLRATYTTGAPGTPTAVLLHYWGGLARTWNPVVDRLGSVPTLRFDQRGWGASAGLPGPYDLAPLADDVLAVAATVEGDWVLVGHSMGGKVGQLVAARRPAGLRRLVLVAPAPPRPAPMVTPDYQGALASAYATPDSVRAALAEVLTARELSVDEADAVVRDSMSGTADATAEWPLVGIAADIGEQAGRIEIPVDVIVGGDDRVEPPDVLRTHLCTVIPQAALTVVESAGHLLPLEAPDEVAAVVASAVEAT